MIYGTQRALGQAVEEELLSVEITDSHVRVAFEFTPDRVTLPLPPRSGAREIANP